MSEVVPFDLKSVEQQERQQLEGALVDVCHRRLRSLSIGSEVFTDAGSILSNNDYGDGCSVNKVNQEGEQRFGVILTHLGYVTDYYYDGLPTYNYVTLFCRR